VTIAADDFLVSIAGLPAADQGDALAWRCRHDVELFCTLMFPALVYLPFNDAHRWLLGHLASLPGHTERARAGMRETAIGVEAPRGLAKTTIAKLIVVHRIVYGLEPFIIWGAVGQREAEQEGNHIRAMFDDPGELFGEIYGPFKVEGGASDWTVRLPSGQTCRVSARGWPGGKMRGINNQGQRPTLIIGDDVEHTEHVRNPAVRAKLDNYISSDVRNAGPKEGGLIFLQVGTRLHPDSQTARNSHDRAFTAVRYRSVITWPDRMDLWQRCKDLWSDLTDPDRLETAERYYRRNRRRMTAGCEVLDPKVQPIYWLMQKLWSVGEASFWKDYLNDPVDPTRQVFFPDKFRRCTHDAHSITTSSGRRIPVGSCKLAIWLDPRASREVARSAGATMPPVRWWPRRR